MKITPTSLPGAVVIEPEVFGDDRGFFMETWNLNRYHKAGINGQFVQSNLSRSAFGVLRGLHFQHPNPQGKLVQVLEGKVFDVAVDIRRNSPHFGKWAGVWLDAESHKQFWIPEGFAHGFCVTSDSALFAYQCTRIYEPQADANIAWNDPDINIQWPIDNPSLSPKDLNAPLLRNMDEDALPA